MIVKMIILTAAACGAAIAPAFSAERVKLADVEVGSPVSFEATGTKLTARAPVRRNGKPIGFLHIGCSASPASISLGLSIPDEILISADAPAWIRLSNGDRESSDFARASQGIIMLHARSNFVNPADAGDYGIATAAKVKWMFEILTSGRPVHFNIAYPFQNGKSTDYDIKMQSNLIASDQKAALAAVVEACASLHF